MTNSQEQHNTKTAQQQDAALDSSFRLCAYDNALTAYDVIAYRIGAEDTEEHAELADALTSVVVTDADMSAAMTVASNIMDVIAYCITPSGIIALARLYAALRETLGDEGYTAVDPLADVCRAKGITLIDEAKRFECMYPGFPKQVMEMDEAQYRFHQLLHYVSTYGVENIVNSALEAAGDDRRIYISEGWLPYRDGGDGDAAFRERPADKRGSEIAAGISSGKMLDVLLTEDELRSKAFDSFAAPVRLTRDALAVVRDVVLAAPSEAQLPRAGFRENALNLAALALTDGSNSDFARVAGETVSTVDDAMKLTSLVASGGEYNGTGKCETHMRTRLTSSQKRAICHQLQRFSADDIRSYGADQKRAVRRALAKLSPAAYIRDVDKLAAVRDVIEGHAPTFDARVTDAASMVDVSVGKRDGDAALGALRELLNLLSERPGIMLRKATMVLDKADAIDAIHGEDDVSGVSDVVTDGSHGSAYNMVFAAFLETAPKMSLASLVQAATVMSSDAAPRFVRSTQALRPFSRWGGKHSGTSTMPSMKLVPELADGDTDKQREHYVAAFGADPFANVARRHSCAERLITPCIREHIASVGGVGELTGKRVRVEWGIANPDASMLIPNEAGRASTGMPLPGVAVPLPEDAVVRFFVYWDDRDKRVDVDLHASAYSGQRWNRIGWDAHYNADGITTSGDITTSENSAEYIDIDFAKARKAGVQCVRMLVHLFSGCDAFNNVDTIRAGALAVGDADAELYSPERCIFTDSLKTVDATSLQYAEIGGIQEGTPWIRVLKGAELPYETAYTMRRYVEDLIVGSGATLVDGDEDETDVVLRLGHAEHDDELSLLDTQFYLDL